MSERLVIEIGGTKIQVAIGTTRGVIVERERCDVPQDATGSKIRELVLDLTHGVKSQGLPESIGIGFGGPVDTKNGLVLRSYQIAEWNNFPLKAWAEEELGLPCIIENDSNCGALGEATLGAGKGSQTVLYTNLGSGIGGGLVINGSLYKRPFGALEIGHTKVWDLKTNRYTDVEDLCSGWSIDRLACESASTGKLQKVLALTGGRVEDVTAKHIGLAANEGDREALAIIEDVTKTFAIPLSNVITLLNPDTVVVGGGISLMGDVFFRPLKEAVDDSVFEPFAGNYEIVPAKLGEDVVLVGALLL